MCDSYDISGTRKRPYAGFLKKHLTIRRDWDTNAYFRSLADQKGIPCQRPIELYLRDCADQHRDLRL